MGFHDHQYPTMTDRKKPGVALWATVVLVVVVLYVASFGPAFRLYFYGCGDWIDEGTEAVLQPWSPILWLSYHGPQPVHDAIL